MYLWNIPDVHPTPCYLSYGCCLFVQNMSCCRGEGGVGGVQSSERHQSRSSVTCCFDSRDIHRQRCQGAGHSHGVRVCFGYSPRLRYWSASVVKVCRGSADDPQCGECGAILASFVIAQGAPPGSPIDASHRDSQTGCMFLCTGSVLAE